MYDDTRVHCTVLYMHRAHVLRSKSGCLVSKMWPDLKKELTITSEFNIFVYSISRIFDYIFCRWEFFLCPKHPCSGLRTWVQFRKGKKEKLHFNGYSLHPTMQWISIEIHIYSIVNAWNYPKDKKYTPESCKYNPIFRVWFASGLKTESTVYMLLFSVQ